MFKKILLFLCCFCVLSNAAYANQIVPKPLGQSRDNLVGKLITLNSTILSEQRDIQIYLPPDYHTNDKHYPVLYVLDGQRLFLHGVSLQQTFTSQFQLSPDFIVVGINNRYPQRFSRLSSSRFVDFIEQELVNYIDNNFRTTDERLLFGWEYAGALVVETMISKPGLFAAHIAASPFPLNVIDAQGSSRNQRVVNALSEKFASFLYFAVSDNEPGVVDGTDELSQLLTQHAPAKLQWHYRKIADEEHRSTAHSILYQALRSYFKFYPKLAINTLAEYDRLGGMEYVLNYNQTRARQFSFSSEIDPWTMYALVRAAMRADNIERFEWFMNEFKQHDFAAKVQFRRTFEIADFYLKYQMPQQAIAWYLTLLQRQPDSAKMHNALGDIYAAQDDKANATKHYQQAAKLKASQTDLK